MMYYRYYNRLDILSFPTRRSSDLDELLTVFDPERHKCQLHGHTDEQLIRIGYRQSRLHPHLAGQFDVTDAIWFKVIVVWKSERRFWAEVLDRPRPQSADA